ncbi:MAG: hypothetical protein RSB71_03285 [Bacilli bacterium]
MKKVLLGSILLGSIFLMVGCGNKTTKYEKVMQEYATTFYNLHQKGTEGLTNPTVSIKQLKEAVSQVKDDFDMKKLDKCEDESYVEIILQDGSKEIKEYKFYMKCK